jgi:16S rRNA (adenine1518-N6/adenine1519-N6)-dimethyltransferase
MSGVKAKKHLGQHFLKDMTICQKIADALIETDKYDAVLEIGPGTGALTQFLLQKETFETSVMEVDTESVVYLNANYENLVGRIYEQDFLKWNPESLYGDKKFAVAGNFPYNISSQILFKVLDHKNQVPEVVGMFQKEVAERIAEGPGSKRYGIISVLLQAFYDIEYLFTVDEHVFDPPPKVKSGVIRLIRNEREDISVGYHFFSRVVKSAFGQRRKTMRNSLKQIINEFNPEFEHEWLTRRPEQLSVEEFITLSELIKG